MLEINKFRNEFGTQFDIKKDDKILSIYYGANLDLYFFSHSNINNNKISFNFDISDGIFYSLLDNLYNDFKNYTYYNDNKLNKKIKEILINKDEIHNLFYNNYIDYHSDDNTYEEAPRLIIKHQNHNYILELINNKNNLEMGINVIISNSKSRYYKANIPFMKMYQNLYNYNIKEKRLVK